MSVDFNVPATDLRDYLKSQGWTVREDALAHRLFVLENSAFERRQFVFPIDAAEPDYLDAVERVVTKLAELTGKTKAGVISRIESLREDVLRLRIFFGDNDQFLPLSFASAAVQNTEKLLRAAACTVLRPRIHHARLTLTEAAQFVEKSKFAQTEKGSFVLKVACPINAMEVQGVLELGDDSAPFVRQVTVALQKSLDALASAIEADTLDRLVDDLKVSRSPIISSNLCEALAGMHDDLINNSLDVGFDWSLLRAPPAGLNSGRAIRFQREYFSRIDEVRRELRSVEVNAEETFIGTVERLEGEMGDDGRRSGPVVLALLLPDEGESVRARIMLDADNYGRASTAHMTPGAYVLVSGRLRPGRQPRQLTDVTRFELVTAGTTHAAVR
jgi:hypothetical protein